MSSGDDIPLIMEREAGTDVNTPEVGVGFGLVAVENAKKSALAGHPVFDDREFVKIIIPGDRQSVYCQPATDRHKQRFPRAYALFKMRETQPVAEGMPIEQWPQVTRAMAFTLRAANIPTVEALAAVGDGFIDTVGGRELRAKAQAFLAIAKDTAESQRIAAESQRKDLVIADMQRQINELAAKLQSGDALKDAPKRGRPRKALTITAAGTIATSGNIAGG